MPAEATFKDFNWSIGTQDEQLELAQTGTDDELRALAMAYDWRAHPEVVLSWIMAQKCIDLGSAITAFLNGEPERFNYMPKRDVPDRWKSTARLLDNICLRVNSGFYLAWPDRDVLDRRRLDRWLIAQAKDREDNRQGRFVLDEAIIASLTKNELRLDREHETAVYAESQSLLRDLLSPVMELGVSRRMLRYLPEEETEERDLRKPVPRKRLSKGR
ncbi:hypothetical protein [Roseovarius rhodophyticola]|uniref:DUF4274 domain-containing protein n=1 Tax=Roseovarius rhodophyticola TaxID=3080827 RepID=A0ABZ2TIJ7_9RHOB|nr:hypothetical protein [Roseovarius sp. W115]MDV2931345.1 hypothetical protein [Roseovarius sp. W115]